MNGSGSKSAPVSPKTVDNRPIPIIRGNRAKIDTKLGMKIVLVLSVLAGIIGWSSVLQNSTGLDITSSKCPTDHQHQQLQDWKIASKTAQQQQQSSQNVQSHPKKRLRVLMGIFTYDDILQAPYRRQFRKLLDVFPQRNDTRVCSLYGFEHAPSDQARYQCQFIYTFVVGGLKKTSARSELVDTRVQNENGEDTTIDILMPSENVKFQRSKDLKDTFHDVTFLNIRENMNEGKSQTWFKYATTIMEQYDVDYAGKIDSDSLPYLDKFFHWAYVYLPPPPFNSGILAGVPIDKFGWSTRSKQVMEEDDNEMFFKSLYGKVIHLYAAGQCYIMSRDLAETIVLEAPRSQAYQEGHEDHDVSAMAFRSSKPISFHFLTIQQQFWRHPVKRSKKRKKMWRTLWHNEHVRLKKVLNLRQEHLRFNALGDDDNFETPDDLTAPVQKVNLEDSKESGEDEEEEEEDEAEGRPGEEIEDSMEQAAQV